MVGVSAKIRRAIVEGPGSLGERSRARRWQLVRRAFPEIEDMSVVDLGGTVQAWERAPVRPERVTVLNLTEPGTSTTDGIVPVLGDACDAIRVLDAAVGRQQYDLVFSNSVLEHLGGHANRSRFAASVRALAPLHWVQTPYRYFPLEPHWLFPGMQFLPLIARAQIARRWPLAHSPASNLRNAFESAVWTELIGVTELRYHFPDSLILHERVGGLTKSIIAVRN